MLHQNYVSYKTIDTEKERNRTKSSEKSERETDIPENNHRRSDDSCFHHMGCSCPLLYDQHWQTSGVFDFARSAGDPTLKPVGEMDVVYRITDYHIVLACSNYCFWLEVPDGVIYLWSRIDDSMVRGGDNMKEALTNYLFNRENLRYVVEYSLELIPLDAYDEEAEEWANSPEAYIDVTRLSLKHESKMGGKKKQQKKKKKKKNKNKLTWK
ncbi:hypothetical protein C1646_749165 [Rhizophagus diaphanus]|nr:hypothetical protein C1646_749165 [Rhizophagus diaphanus] [Rhizophagus sp. MUCL 43196]